MAFGPGTILDPDDRISVVINGQTFLVWDENRSENFAHSIPTQKATWTFVCLWEDRVRICATILGGSTGIAGTTLFLNGWQYPDNSAWLAQQCTTVGDGLRSQYVITNQQETSTPAALLNFQRARVTVSFGIPDFTVGQPNNLGEQELDFSSNSVPLTQNATSYLWAGGSQNGEPLPISMSPVLRYTTVQFTQSRYNVAVLPIQTVITLVDCVNQDVFFGGQAETVLFKGARSTRTITPTGATNWTVTFSFEENRNGWNKIYNSKDSQWVPFTRNDGSKLFTPANLNALYTA